MERASCDATSRTCDAETPWTNVAGAARTLLALGTLSTLAAHDADMLFRPLGVEAGEALSGTVLLRFSIFSLLSGSRLELARWLCVAGLCLVASGWRPRLTGLLHWWISASFAASCVIVDGGDQVTAVLTLLVLPLVLTDPRRSHWAAAPETSPGAAAAARALIARSALLVIRIQVALIYLVSCASKFAVREWTNGTALYYWFLHPVFGVSGWRRDLLLPVLTHPAGVALLTWGVLAFEALLFAGLVMEKRLRPGLLAAGCLFHFGTVVVHGLFSFFLAMAGALVLYLRSPQQQFRQPAWLAGFAARRTRRHGGTLEFSRGNGGFADSPIPMGGRFPQH